MDRTSKQTSDDEIPSLDNLRSGIVLLVFFCVLVSSLGVNNKMKYTFSNRNVTREKKRDDWEVNANEKNERNVIVLGHDD